MFNNTKYTKWYLSIIDNARARINTGYTERHHVIPKSLGGTNKKENIINLTAREHYICHILLTKMLSGLEKQKMVYALWILSNRTSKKNSRIFQTTREEFSTVIKNRKHTDESKKKMSRSQSGKILSEETKQKLRDANVGLIRNFSDEHCKNLSKAGKGRVITDEWKANLSSANKGQGLGRKLSDETKAKLSARRRATLAKKASSADASTMHKTPDPHP